MAVTDLLAAGAPLPDAVRVVVVDTQRMYDTLADDIRTRHDASRLTLVHAATFAEAERMLAVERVDVVVLGEHAPDGAGVDWLRDHRTQLQAGAIVLTSDAALTHLPETVEGADAVFLAPQLEAGLLVQAIFYAAAGGRVRRSLTRGREYFQWLIEHSGALITVVDDHGVVAYQSPASSRLLGYAPDAFVGRPLTDLLPADQEAPFAAMMASAIDGTGSGSEWELTLRHADGTLRTLVIMASATSPAPGMHRVVLNAHDGTERRRAEEELRKHDQIMRQAQKMEAVGRLAGGIAHDFNNVLSIITAACERLQDAAARMERADPVMIETILRNTSRAAGLTRQLLAFSRQQALTPEPLDLGTLTRESSEFLKPLIGASINLTVRVPPDLRPVKVDRVQIEQVLMNLAINARDAMPRGGSLTIQLCNILADAEFVEVHQPMVPGPYVLLSVSDTGHGMDPTTMARAFEPFFTTKGPGSGTGLGLSTVYGIVKQSGGFIWIDTEVGQGTTFRIYLPPTDAVPSPPITPPRNVATAVRRPATILLTEDEPDVRELLRAMLTSNGYSVIEATNPAEALQKAETHDIELLLTDVVMPGGSGSELAHQIRQSHPRLKILFMSGYPEPIQTAHGAELPDSLLDPDAPFISKPFTRDTLLARIHSLLG